MGNTFHQRQELRHIMAIDPGQDDIDLDALRIDGEVMFAAFIGGDRLGSLQFSPWTARTAKLSAITRDNSSLSAPLHLARSARRSLVHMPACCHVRSWRQQVMLEPQPIFWGSVSQGMPDRNTNRIRIMTRGRPGACA
jgi:hypothetical protein